MSSRYQSIHLASSSCYVGYIAFRDQLDWTGAAWVLAAANFRRGRQNKVASRSSGFGLAARKSRRYQAKRATIRQKEMFNGED
jgi:hypothetical protein